MKRNFDLIRKIMLDAEAMPAGSLPFSLEYPNEYSPEEVNAHVALLKDAGLLNASIASYVEGGGTHVIDGLTWDGHNFAQAVASASIWQKAFSIVKTKGAAMTFDVLKALLAKLALEAAGA
jgi:hypothetical protein